MTKTLLRYIIVSVLENKTKGSDNLKITLIPAELEETEIVIKGDVTSDEVEAILQLLRNKNTSKKLFLYSEDEQHLVDISEIVYFEACNNKINAFTESNVYSTKLKLYELKDKLAQFQFAQINKSIIVNIDYVKSVQAEFSGNYSLRLKNRKEILTISRKYFKEFKSHI